VSTVNNDAYLYGKPPTPIGSPKRLKTSPAEVLHELGMATTLLAASPLAQVARHWAHVRYCATLTANHTRLALSRPADDVVYHHKVTQSEQLGIGLALVTAKAVRYETHPDWEISVVDAEVALKAGFVEGVGHEVRQRAHTAKRPDYILVGRKTSRRRTWLKYWILECKGTHGNPKRAIKQLATASVQVRALEIGGSTPPSFLVASCLGQAGITTYLLDPPGDGELWSGPTAELNELLRDTPEDQYWRPQPAPAPTADSGGGAADTSPAEEPGSEEGATEEPDPEDIAPGPPDVFTIPEDRRGWFAQILTRAAAAATLRFPNRLHLEGTRFQTPLPDRRVLEVFRGKDPRLYRMLASGDIGGYLRVAPAVYRRWMAHPRPLPTGVVSYGRDGTALVIRTLSR
jgi:hypothetical protein